MNLKSLICLSLLIFSVFVSAADKNEAYAIKGVGTLYCSKFVEAIDEGNQAFLVYGGWVEGYLTALNQQLDSTYDLAPWQSTEFLLRFVEASCRKSPKVQFQLVVKAMVAELAKQKLTTGGQYVLIKGGKGMLFQEEIVRRAKASLAGKGFYKGDSSIVGWSDAVRSAMKAFQKSKNLEQTGLPDQATLLHLFQPGS